jgi:S-DNA-T family DNA segregation ATPase FtsK/SpoIIIE
MTTTSDTHNGTAVEQEDNPMGNVLRFPGPRTEATEPAVQATAQRLDREPENDDQAQAESEVGQDQGEPETGTELTSDTSRDIERQPVLPAALVGKVKQVAKVALPVAGRTTRFTARHLYYLGGGAWDTFSAAYARWSGRDIDDRIRTAQAAGEHGVAADLMRQRIESKKLFLERIRVFGQFFVRLPVIVGGLAALTLVTTLIVSIVALCQQGLESFEGVWGGLFGAVASGFEWIVWAVTVPLPILVIAAFAGLLIKGYNNRRRNRNAPVWMQSPDYADSVDTLDEGSILSALRNLGIAKLDQAFKQGWGTPEHPARVWETGLGKDGKGWRCQVRLPQGVPVSEVSRKKERLAHNLGRLAVEVWVSEPKDKASVLDLWIADPGVLTSPVDDWPLLAELENATADYFSGVPVGVNIRGDEVTGEFSGKNWAVAGMMGSGKSTLVITALLGLILDPLVDIDVFVMAQNADYELMRPRLRSLVTGASEATVEACMSNLRELYDELEVRGNALAEHTLAGDPDAEKVTRRLAEKDDRLRPKVMVVDECQALFMHEKYGEEAQRVAILLMNASRKYGITLIFLTPEPSTDSLPRKLMAVMSNKACFAIGDQQSNDAILGTSAYKRGISAVGLEPKTKDSNGDVGTAMTSSGFLSKPGLVRSYFVPRNQHRTIVDRALALREAAHISTEAVTPEKRDVLADSLAVMGTEETRASHVVDAMAARWSHYQGWGIKELVAALAEEGVKVPSTRNRYPVDPTTVRDVLAARESVAATSEE